jgi:hypothetical protein
VQKWLLGLFPHRPDIFLAGMHVVFIGSASICLVSALLTGWRLYKNKALSAKFYIKRSPKFGARIWAFFIYKNNHLNQFHKKV